MAFPVFARDDRAAVGPEVATRALLAQQGDCVWVVVAPGGAIVFTDSATPAYIDPLARPPAEARLGAGRPYHIDRVARPAP